MQQIRTQTVPHPEDGLPVGRAHGSYGCGSISFLSVLTS